MDHLSQEQANNNGPILLLQALLKICERVTNNQ